MYGVTSWNKWNDKERILKIPTGSGYFVLKLGFDSSFNPVCQVGGVLWSSASKFSGESNIILGENGPRLDASEV